MNLGQIRDEISRELGEASVQLGVERRVENQAWITQPLGFGD